MPIAICTKLFKCCECFVKLITSFNIFIPQRTALCVICFLSKFPCFFSLVYSHLMSSVSYSYSLVILIGSLGHTFIISLLSGSNSRLKCLFYCFISSLGLSLKILIFRELIGQTLSLKSLKFCMTQFFLSF